MDNKNEMMETSDFEFLQEKIKERPVNKKKLLKRTITTASLAVLFGVLACLSFLLLEPVLNNWIYPEEEPEIVTFPQEKNEKLPEDMLTEGTTGSTEKETDADQADKAGDGTAQDAEKDGSEADTGEGEPETEIAEPYKMQYDGLYAIYNEVAPSIVTVTAVHSDVDWFNNPSESEGSTAGVIIANNNRELLILSRKSPLDGAETIRIGFGDGTISDAQIKQFDKNTDLAVLAVDLKYIRSNTLDKVAVAELGSSSESMEITGKPVMAVGNLFGYNDNVCYGMVTSSGNPVPMADSEYKLITTDIYACTSPSGILVNMDREVVGIVDNTYNHDDTKNLLSAIGITELKGIITKLSNGAPIPYLGIYAQDIDARARGELGLPQGAYIFDIDMDSPAMRKGIQKGDILMRVGTQEISSAADYMYALRNAPMERVINITVQRASGDKYEEMNFTIQPAER